MKVDLAKLCQIEIKVSDRARAESFYLNVLGWKTVPVEILNYSLFEVPDDCPYGISLVGGAADSDRLRSPIFYFVGSDLEEIAAKAKEFGGGVRGGARSIPGGGQSLVIEDPDGNSIGIYAKS